MITGWTDAGEARVWADGVVRAGAWKVSFARPAPCHILHSPGVYCSLMLPRSRAPVSFPRIFAQSTSPLLHSPTLPICLLSHTSTLMCVTYRVHVLCFAQSHFPTLALFNASDWFLPSSPTFTLARYCSLLSPYHGNSHSLPHAHHSMLLGLPSHALSSSCGMVTALLRYPRPVHPFCPLAILPCPLLMRYPNSW